MSNKPLISIIVPVYNTGKYLEKCVKSCLSQTYENLEVLLVDDGSTDGTGSLCDEWQRKDNRVRVFHKENGGTSSARNLGIKEAGGEYLGFVDSDDFIGETMYEKLVNAIQKHGVPVAQVSRDEIDAEGNRMPDVCTPPKQEYLCETEEFMRELLMHRGDCSFCTKLIAGELLAGKEFPVGKLNEDFFLLLQVLEEVQGIYSLPDQEYHVFYRVGSNTRKENKNEFSRVFMDIVDNADYATDIVERNYPNLREVCIRFNLFQRLDYMLHIPILKMRGDNVFYSRVKKYLRGHIADIIRNPYLTKKNKLYLLPLSVCPKLTRKVHAAFKRM